MGAIMLVPEISLTTQTIERFRSRFQKKIAVLHHRLSPGERFDQWHSIRKGESSIVIGARSAIFSPIQNLGLIIIDEEHEQTYKQTDTSPCYNARDVAVMRGKLCNIPVVLGSATPSIESFFNTQQKKYVLSKLTDRIEKCLPTVTIIDMKKELEKGHTIFSDLLLSEIKNRHKKGEQSILFLNRRGYNTSLLCKKCGNVISCPNCDISLSYHKSINTLSCHLCNHSLPPPNHCPSCHSETIKYTGIGTEQVENTLHAIMPEIRTIRMDGDTTKHKGSHDRLFRHFRTGKADVLIGTQMISKGLHFPAVTLVGILNSDASLNLPDFRASEQTFQIITQVSGRSGRGPLPGNVIIQSFMTDNHTIQTSAKQDFELFYNTEIQSRQFFQYPPYVRMVKITFTGPCSKKPKHMLTHSIHL